MDYPPRQKDRYLPFLIFTTVAFVLLSRIYDYDIWYHLAIGREIYQSSAIPATEFMVYTLAGEPGIFHAWGFDLLYYLIYSSTGYWGMSVANALIGASILFFLLMAAGGLRPSAPAALIVLCAVLWLLHFRLVYRPETLFYLALAAVIYLMERFSEDRRWYRLVPLPFIALLAIQAHPSVLFLLAVYALYALQILWDDYRQKQKTGATAVRLALCGFITLAASLINPYGMEQLLMPFTLAASDDMLKDIVEFLPVYETEYLTRYILLVAASAVALGVQPKKRIADWVLFFLFGYMAFRYVRNVGLFALVMYVPMARGAACIAGKWSLLQSVSAKRAVRFAAAAVVVYTVAARVSDPTWGSGPQEGKFPEKSAKIIGELRPPGRIFNFYDMGGYLEWVLNGEYQVSIDSRQLTMDRSLILHDNVLSGVPQWERALDQYNVNTIVIPATLPYSGMLVPLVPLLADNPGWVLAAVEKKALLFFKRGILPDRPSKYRLNREEVWRQIIREAQNIIDEYPDHPKAYLALGRAQLRMGERKAAIDSYRRYTRLRPDDKTYEQLLNRLESGN